MYMLKLKKLQNIQRDYTKGQLSLKKCKETLYKYRRVNLFLRAFVRMDTGHF